jgi:hypothetical protein
MLRATVGVAIIDEDAPRWRSISAKLAVSCWSASLRKREQARLEALAADGEVLLAGKMSTTPGRQMRVAATISGGPSRGERRLAMREARDRAAVGLPLVAQPSP